jgi:hypothetical protein
MTSAWWLETTPQASWQLIADASAMDRVMTGWRAWTGLRLRLRVGARAMEPFRLVEWQVEGDFQATLTWVISSAIPSGSDVTCRCETKLVPGLPAWVRTLECLLLERVMFGRMRACAKDMAVALGCRSSRLREWSGLTRR